MNAPLFNGQVAVIGAGTMGIGIAQVAAAAGHPVRLFDIAPAAAQRAIDDLARRLRQRVDGGKAATTNVCRPNAAPGKTAPGCATAPWPTPRKTPLPPHSQHKEPRS